MPIRTGNSSARCAAIAASTADLGDANAAHTPSPVCLNNKPPCASIAVRNTSSWAASATRIASASASHRRVEPSTSVNRNVTTPEGAAAAGADTRRISQQTRSYLAHRRNPAPSPDRCILRRTSASHRCRLFRDNVGGPPSVPGVMASPRPRRYVPRSQAFSPCRGSDP